MKTGTTAGILLFLFPVGCGAAPVPVAPETTAAPRSAIQEYRHQLKHLQDDEYRRRVEASKKIEALAYRNPEVLREILLTKVDDPESQSHLRWIVNGSKYDIQIDLTYREEEGKAAIRESYSGSGGHGYSISVHDFYFFSGSELVGTYQRFEEKFSLGAWKGGRDLTGGYGVPNPPEEVDSILVSIRTFLTEESDEDPWFDEHYSDAWEKFTTYEKTEDSYRWPLFLEPIDSDVESHFRKTGLKYSRGIHRTELLKVIRKPTLKQRVSKNLLALDSMDDRQAAEEALLLEGDLVLETAPLLDRPKTKAGQTSLKAVVEELQHARGKRQQQVQKVAEEATCVAVVSINSGSDRPEPGILSRLNCYVHRVPKGEAKPVRFAPPGPTKPVRIEVALRGDKEDPDFKVRMNGTAYFVLLRYFKKGEFDENFWYRQGGVYTNAGEVAHSVIPVESPDGRFLEGLFRKEKK